MLVRSFDRLQDNFVLHIVAMRLALILYDARHSREGYRLPGFVC